MRERLLGALLLYYRKAFWLGFIADVQTSFKYCISNPALHNTTDCTSALFECKFVSSRPQDRVALRLST